MGTWGRQEPKILFLLPNRLIPPQGRVSDSKGIKNPNCERGVSGWSGHPRVLRARRPGLFWKTRHWVVMDGVCVCAWRGMGSFTLTQRHISVRLTWTRTRRCYVDSTVKQIELSPPDLYFLYFCVLMLRLYASGLTHLTMAVHVPFIKDHGTCTAAAQVCVCGKDRNRAGFVKPLLGY